MKKTKKKQDIHAYLSKRKTEIRSRAIRNSGKWRHKQFYRLMIKC
jgi:hypothetical protein